MHYHWPDPGIGTLQSFLQQAAQEKPKTETTSNTVSVLSFMSVHNCLLDSRGLSLTQPDFLTFANNKASVHLGLRKNTFEAAGR